MTSEKLKLLDLDLMEHDARMVQLRAFTLFEASNDSEIEFQKEWALELLKAEKK